MRGYHNIQLLNNFLFLFHNSVQTLFRWNERKKKLKERRLELNDEEILSRKIEIEINDEKSLHHSENKPRNSIRIFFQVWREREKCVYQKMVWNGSSEKDRKMLSIPKVPSWSFPKNMPEKFKLNENGNKYLILTFEISKSFCFHWIIFGIKIAILHWRLKM